MFSAKGTYPAPRTVKPVKRELSASRYAVIDGRTGEQVGRSYAVRSLAVRRADKLDNAYGAYRYTVRELPNESDE